MVAFQFAVRCSRWYQIILSKCPYMGLYNLLGSYPSAPNEEWPLPDLFSHYNQVRSDQQVVLGEHDEYLGHLPPLTSFVNL